MRLGHVEQLAGALQFGHAQHQLHGHLGCLAVLASEDGAVALAEDDAAGMSVVVGDGSGAPVVIRGVGKELQALAVDACDGVGVTLQFGESRMADAQHRQLDVEYMLGDQGAEAENLVGFGQHQRCRCRTVEKQLQHNAAARAGAASAGNGQYAPGQGLPAQRMVSVDHLAAERVDAAP